MNWPLQEHNRSIKQGKILAYNVFFRYISIMKKLFLITSLSCLFSSAKTPEPILYKGFSLTVAGLGAVAASFDKTNVVHYSTLGGIEKAKNEKKASGEIKASDNPALMHTVEGDKLTSCFVKNQEIKHEDATLSGRPFLGGINVNVGLFKVDNFSILGHIGVLSSFGQINQTTEITTIKRAISGPAFIVGSMFEYDFGSVSMLGGPCAVIYKEKLKVSMQEGQFTQDYLKDKCTTIKKELLPKIKLAKGELPSDKDVDQTNMQENFKAVLKEMSPDKEEENSISTPYSPTLGLNFGLKYFINKDKTIAVGASYLYVFSRTVSLKLKDEATNGQRISKILLSSGRAALVEENDTSKEGIHMPAMHLVSVFASYKIF